MGSAGGDSLGGPAGEREEHIVQIRGVHTELPHRDVETGQLVENLLEMRNTAVRGDLQGEFVRVGVRVAGSSDRSGEIGVVVETQQDMPAFGELLIGSHAESAAADRTTD